MFVGEIRAALEGSGAKRHAAGQIFRWLHARRAHDFASMSDLPAVLREELAARFGISTAAITGRQVSGDGTVKFMVAFPDGVQVETVVLREKGRKTQCVSTQAGCALGCRFCATGALGFTRDLTAGEIAAQVEDVQAAAGRAGGLVFMGMGEPFLNYDNVLRAVRILNDAGGLGVGARHVTISTAGIPAGIRRLAREGLQVRLSVSLNATTDETRSRLMPVNRRHPLLKVLDAVDYYARASGRRVTLEYVLVPGENDTGEDLERLAGIARALKAYVNLIELNPGPWGAAGGERKAVLRWKRRLLARGVQAAARFKRGLDIQAGCGQLASRRGG